MQALIEVILPVFLVIGFGYFALWAKWFTDDGVEGLMKFTQNFAVPCLLFTAIARLDLSQNFEPRLLLSFYTGAASGFFIAMLGARFIFQREWEDCVAIGFCGLFSNSLLLGLPISERAYGEESLAANYAIIAVHSPFCYAIGITAMEIARNRGGSLARLAPRVLRAVFSNALVIGVLLGFAVNLTGLPLPGGVWAALDLIARSALPAALFGLGGVLFRYRPEGDLRVICFVCLVSLVIHPAIVWLVGTGVQLERDQFRAAVVTAAMAPGVNAYVFANMYGAARRVAASAVLLATLGTIFTAWAWLTILR